VRARFSAPIETGPGAHPASNTTGTRSFPLGKAAGVQQWRNQELFCSGWGFNKFSWGHRAERTGIWGR